MAKLTGQTIADSYDQLLIVTGASGITSSLQAVESADTSSNSSALKISTVGIEVDTNFTGTTSATTKGAHIDFDKSGVTASGQTATNIGLDLDMNDAATNHGSGTVVMTGIDVDVVSASADGTITNTGINIAVSGADTNYALITSGGNVGINAADPGSLLDIRGAAGTGAASAGVLTLSTAETSIRVGSVDQLGRIDFQAPKEGGGTDALLVGASIHAVAEEDFSSSNNSTALVFSTGTTTVPIERVRIDQDGLSTFTGALTVGADGAGHDVVFHSGTGSDNFTWDASEECLIITGTDGAQALKVADGDLVVVDKLYIFDNDGGEYLSGDGATLTITAGAASAMKLDANSRISLSNNASSSTGGTDGTSGNTVFGYLAGDTLHGSSTTGHDNVLIGHKAGNALTTADENIAIGSLALTSLAGAANGNIAIGQAAADALAGSSVTVHNIAIGNHALGAADDNTSTGGEVVDHNIAIGYRALTSGDMATATANLQYNIAIGGYALDSTLTNAQTGTIAIGHSALTALTSGGGNTAVGHQVHQFLTTGDRNTGIGYQAMYNTSGAGAYDSDDNTAIGYNCMSGDWLTTKSINNTAVGSGAMVGAMNAGNNNTAVGKAAGAAITTAGENTIVGSEAGDHLTTGANNVAIGRSALGVTTAGLKMVAIGQGALADGLVTAAAVGTVGIGMHSLLNLVDGVGCTAIGYQSQMANTSSDYNTSVGFESLIAVTTGTGYNVAVGYKAGNAITDGIYNTAVGTNALYSEDQGDSCTAIGTSALYTQNGANAVLGNTGVGHNAGYYNGTGTNNTLIGYLAGQGTTASNHSGNTAVGKSALYAVTSGGVNCCVGESAGSALTTGDNNTFLGSNCGSNLVDGGQNTMIGRSVVVSATDVTYEMALGYNIAGAGTETMRIGMPTDYITNDFGENATWTHSSDERIKKDISDSELGLDFIKDLRPVTFKKKAPSEYPEEFDQHDASKTERKSPDRIHYGFIAQEVKKAMDKAGHSEFPVWSEQDDGMQELGEAEFITPLIKAVQELSAKVEELEEKLK